MKKGKLFKRGGMIYRTIFDDSLYANIFLSRNHPRTFEAGLLRR